MKRIYNRKDNFHTSFEAIQLERDDMFRVTLSRFGTKETSLVNSSRLMEIIDFLAQDISIDII